MLPIQYYIHSTSQKFICSNSEISEISEMKFVKYIQQLNISSHILKNWKKKALHLLRDIVEYIFLGKNIVIFWPRQVQ